MTASCSSCMFGFVTGWEDSKIECRRNPPTPHTKNGAGVFPQVTAQMWCGEHASNVVPFHARPNADAARATGRRLIEVD